MAKTATIRARVDAKLKAEAEAVLGRLGISASDAIRIFYRQVSLQKGLPFEVKLPNSKTRKAMRELAEGKGRISPDTDSMFKELGLD